MIQRIQSIWLLLSGISLFGLFLFPYLMYSNPVGLGKSIYVTGVFSSLNNVETKESSFLLLTIATVVLALIPILIIFFFKDRKLQLKLILLQVILVCLLAVGMWFSASSIWDMNNEDIKVSNIGVGYFILPISILFLSFAIRGIRNDEKLIKSADRLR
ncbi:MULTISPECIES: DUF4293 domain-containing protein [Sphingobacterium]|uniref:DUF4293 domain-containing protein n=1 Tax=Sphingobacterium tenebrionis TaxID=3111775 RepID=A0ABU8I5J8_9SPHI|nr:MULTISPECIES: DUF4293 domain-containing protein [unclassified Sphingobacterium]QBR10801.1 DUF4293 family protein [Sphingobacterium sp. CZ-2]